MSTAQTDILIYRDRAGGGGPIKKIEESFKKLQSLADLSWRHLQSTRHDVFNLNLTWCLINNNFMCGPNVEVVSFK